jgi:hypothetical protein
VDTFGEGKRAKEQTGKEQGMATLTPALSQRAREKAGRVG